jgi:hypothetical protein
MIALPTSGMGRSIEKHNSDHLIASDWLEIVVMLSEEGWSQADVSDVLIEGNIYREQTFAAEFVQSMFAEIRRRRSLVSPAYPIAIGGSGDLVPVVPPESATALLFCLLLTVGPNYSAWGAQFGGDYREQGDLFELLMVSALRYWFPAWEVTRTGWGDGTQLELTEFVQLIATAAREELMTNWGQFVPLQANDLGLDIMAVRSFADDEGGLPILMCQCASGKNWVQKLTTPDTKAWHRVMSVTHTPLRALATPMVIPLGEVKSRRNKSHGLIVDRYRLLPPVPDVEWLDGESTVRIKAWCAARIEWLRQTHPLN